jgi:hypothetical protein
MPENHFKKWTVLLLVITLSGCQSVPEDIFRLPANSLEVRQLQSRQYPTTDETKIMQACAGVLQDLGFTLDESESKLGLVVGSKDRDATDGGQVALATLATAMSAFSGTYSNAYQQIDKQQKIKASVVTHLSADKSKVLVRVTFQRIVWNAAGNVNRVESLKEPELYTGFFDRLSKSIFLEEQKI